MTCGYTLAAMAVAEVVVAEGFEPSDGVGQVRHSPQLRGYLSLAQFLETALLGTLWAHFKSIAAATASRSASNKSA
jgi:hypothetical protein